MNTEQKEKAFDAHAPKERDASMRKSSTHDVTKEESEELEQQYQKLRQAAFARRAKGAKKCHTSGAVSAGRSSSRSPASPRRWAIAIAVRAARGRAVR